MYIYQGNWKKHLKTLNSCEITKRNTGGSLFNQMVSKSMALKEILGKPVP